MNNGLVHLYTGDGKGKTTAAVGLSIRAIGNGNSVLFCQFLKPNMSGELGQLEKLGVLLLRSKQIAKFTFEMTPAELEQAKSDHLKCFNDAIKLINSGKYNLIVLDEILDAVNAGVIKSSEICKLLQNRPQNTEIVITGRSPGACIIEAADYHTDFVCKKHPFNNGVAARAGIEY